jgi:hypothetical protein
MPDKETIRRSQQKRRRGDAPSTQAGEFVREEIHHVREGKHGARNAKQAIAIGLSQARRAGVDLPPPKRGTTSDKTRKSAERAYARGHAASARRAPSAKRSRGIRSALKREGHSATSRASLSRQTRQAASRRAPSERSAAARKGMRTKGPARRKAAAKKAARTRANA